ncbi:amino acid-binding protein [Propionicicella superfundia]|uniref:amino acid-binding protein n=1 Tax=Propionicicella superfundia TaxID=348582 RepID=UPI00040CDD3F|nr:amino acid-binding protein [Propionicicella superfundia]
MFLLRVAIPDRPGSLGAVATALGTIFADISAVEIVEKHDDLVVDDFMIEVPPGTPPDMLVTACSALPGVRVLWVSHYPEHWGLHSDIEVVEAMSEAPAEAHEILTDTTPATFRCHWALLIDRDTRHVARATDVAPVLDGDHGDVFGDLVTARIDILPDGWLDGWSETEIALAPLRERYTIVAARRGGPPFMVSELARLRHLATIA